MLAVFNIVNIFDLGALVISHLTHSWRVAIRDHTPKLLGDEPGNTQLENH